MSQSAPTYKDKTSLIRGKEFLTDPLNFTIKNAQELGGLYRIPFYFRKLFIITDLEAVKHILQANQRNYVKSPAYEQLKQALGNGLVTSEGDFWRKQRRMAQPAFYKKQLDGLFKTMGKIAEDYCQELEQKRGQVLDISLEMMQVTASIVLKTLFSSEQKNDKTELSETMEIAQSYIMHRVTAPHLIPLTYINGRRRKFKKALKLFDNSVFELIEERKKDPSPPHDLLTMLLQARDEETGEGMGDRQLRDEAITIYSAGHETSSNGLSWTLFLLAQHPEIVQKVRNEVTQVLEKDTPSFDDLRALTYTRQVIEESMRLYPPVYAVGREALNKDEVIGYHIPRKSIIFISIYAIHRDPKYWENPDVFDPSRFEPEKVKARPKLAYMPFGAGPRMCIGNHFAMMEMQLLLAMLIRQFDFELVKDFHVEPNPLVTLKPKYGIQMLIK